MPLASPFAFLGPFHPQIVHTPIALLIFSAFFAIVGRLFDRDWLRKSSALLLVIGFVGAYAAEQSGVPAHRVPEHEQGVPERDIDAHGDSGHWVVWLAGGAVIALAISSRLQGNAANVVAVLALLLQLGAAVMVGVAGYRGGKLVYEHAANVHVDGRLVKSADAGKHPEGEGESEREPGGDRR